MRPDVRAKWNSRYQEHAAEPNPLTPNAFALRFSERVHGGVMLDAACGRGAGIAAMRHRVEFAIGVDLSEGALAAARRHWGDDPRIAWIQADVSQLTWPPRTFALVCAFGFTDWDFLSAVPGIVRSGGLFLYQGFARRQLSVKPELDPAWTSTPETIAAPFAGWQVLACEESQAPPYRVSFAGVAPAD